jgi:hypothetical protein
MLKEKKAITEFDWKVFPPYLCYGQIDESSKRVDGDNHVADYLMNGKKVLEVRINEKYTEIQDYWDGKYLGLSHYSTIRQSVLSHYSFIDQLKSPIQQEWVNSVITSANIYVEYIDIKKIDSIVFPGVFLIDLYIPVRLNDEKILTNIIEHDFLVFFDCDYSESVLAWKSKETSTVYQERINLIKIKIPIAFVQDVVSELKEYIYTDKKWRAFTEINTSKRSTSLKLFYGNEKDTYHNYSILIK